MKRKPTIVVGINSLASSKYAAYTNHLQLMYNFGRRYPQYDFCLVNPDRMSIDRMRNMAAEAALAMDAKYLLFIDDDVVIPMDGLRKLLECDADIAAGDVIIRGYPFNHMLFKWTDKTKQGLKPIANLPRKRGVIRVGAVGFSFCLIRCEIMREITQPYFVTGLSNTEDIYFCVKVTQKNPKIKIVADTRVTCGHILWDEIISSDNKKNYRRYYETQYPLAVQDANPKKSEHNFRGKQYLSDVKAVINA